MSHVLLVTVPNNRENPDKTFAAVQAVVTASSYSTMSKIEVPNLVVGTLDTLMSLADELGKIGTVIENVVRKVERQYLEMAGTKPEPLRIQDVTVEAYLQRFQWDFAQYQQQGRQLGELVSQIQAMAGKVDEDLKTLNVSYMDKTVLLAAAKRKKVVNLSTSDLEDFLTPADMTRIDALNTEHLLTVFVVVPASLEQEFLDGYGNIGESIAAYGGPDWRTSTSRVGENDGKYGAALERTAVTGSPVVPGSAVKVAREGDQVMYAITVLKGHYQAGVVVDDVYTNGNFVDYVEPLKQAFREKRFVVRDVVFDATRAGGVDGAIQQAEHEMAQVRNAALRWCRAHFGEIYGGWMHLKLVQAFVESVLRYGLPVDFVTFLVVPNPKVEKEVRTRLTNVVLQLRPELQMKKLLLSDEEEDGEGADDSDTLPYVCLKFSVIGSSTL